MAYRELGEGWEVAWWPLEPPEADVPLGALGQRVAVRDAVLLDELQKQVDLGPDRPLDPAATIVRRRPLRFYDRPGRHHVLHEIFRLGSAATERARVVRAVGADGATLEWIPLAWTSAPIHDLNEAAGSQPLAGAEAGTVIEYADFFTGSIEGDAGTFQVVRFGGIERVADEQGKPRDAVGADVLYSGTLFHCTFHVGADGSIEMAGDEPFDDAALPAAFRWLEATKRVQPTIRVHVAIAADAFLKCMGAARPESELLAELERGVASPDTLARWLRKRDPLNVLGNVDAPAGTRFLHNWDLGGVFSGRRVVLEGSLTLARCRLEQGFALSGWTVRQGCRLDHAEIHGDLVLDDVRIDNLASAFEQAGEPPLNLRAAHVSGDIRCSRTRVAGEVRLRYARVRGQVELVGMEVTGSLDAQGLEAAGFFGQPAAADAPTRIGGDLSLSAARIPGHVQLEPVHIGGSLQVVTPLELGALYLRQSTDAEGRATGEDSGRATVGGAILLGNVKATGRIELALASCGAGIELRNVACGALTVRGAVGPGLVAAGLETRGDVLVEDLAVAGAAASAAPLSLRHARIAGDLCIAGPMTVPAEVPGHVTLTGAEVQGRVELASLRIGGDLDLDDMVVKRNLCLLGVEVGDALVMRHLACKGDVDLEGATVRGDVELHHAVVTGTLALCSEDGPRRAGIGGKLFLNAVSAGKLVMTGDSWASPAAAASPAAPGPGAARYLAWPALIGLGLVGLPLAALAIAAALLGAGALGSAMLGGIEYEGDWASLWIGLKWLFWTAVAAVVLFRIARMGSMLRDLRRAPAARTILTAAADDAPDGRLHAELLRLWGAALVRALLLVTLAGTVFATRIRPEFLAARLAGGVPDAPALPWVALLLAVAWVALLNVRVCGATGYWLSQLPRPARPEPAGVPATLFALDVAAYLFAIAWLALGAALPGHVRLGAALGVTVLFVGAVRLLAARPAPSTLRMGFLDASSDGPGGDAGANPLRLDAAQVTLSFRDWLQVATMNRLRPAVVPRHEPKCSLERARIGHLKIVHPVPDYVDIGNLVVDRWDLPENPGDTRSYQYLNLLSHASEFATDSFTGLERSLRNAGDREAAEVLHRSMRRETQWRERRWAQTASMLVLSLGGFGTKRARLIGLMTLWLLSTAFWFAADYDRAVGIGLAQQSEFMEVADDQCMPVAGAEGVPAGAGRPARASPPACERSARAVLFDAVLARPDAPLDRLGHGLALAIRYHVPILAWDIRPFIFPRGAGMWVYMSLVEAIHWVLWPILIASLVPAVLPRKDD